MKIFLLSALLAFSSEQPVRWLPVVFEKAAWLPGERPTLTTDLGRFRFSGSKWETVSRSADPVVPLHRVRAAAFLDAELTLSPHEAAAQLAEGGTKIIVMRRSAGVPVQVDLPSLGGVRASSLRLVAELEDAWFVQGVGIAGDARLGIFLLRLARSNAGAAQVRGLADAPMPAFTGSVSLGGEHWFLPDPASESQDAWVLRKGRWRQEAPPTRLSVFLDAQVNHGALWLAYSDGIAIYRDGKRAWYPLRVELEEPGWLCAASETTGKVRGRWVRGAELVGWGVGDRAPEPDFPLDGSSCEFFTGASASQGLVTPLSVKITLESELPPAGE